MGFTTSTTQIAGRSLFGTLGYIFKWSLLTIFIIFILGNAISIAVKERDITPAIKDIGSRLFLITKTINDQSLEIIERGGIYQATPKFWGGVWNMIADLGSLLSSIYIAWVWIKVMARLLVIFPIMDDSKTTTGYLLGIFIFFGLQIVLVLLTGNDSIMTPINAVYNLGRVLPYLFGMGAKFGDYFFNKEMIANASNVISNNASNISAVANVSI